jgi:ABC-2 type transport system ATP-binding protein
MLEVGSGFHSELSGRENIYLNGSILGMSKKLVDSRLEEIIDFSGVEKFIDQPVKNYSSGMYVRLGFAIAINIDPDILVVDEVLSVGDAEFQLKCFGRFSELKAEGKTVILVSHSTAIVQDMCDQAAWVNKGELMQVGDAQPTIQAYLDSVPHDAS